MKYRMSKALGLNTPPDGFTPEEVEIEAIIARETIESLYKKLPTYRMKFIVATHFDLGWPQELLADILGIKQPTLKEEIELIKMVILGYKYKPRKFKDQVTLENVLNMLTLFVEGHKKKK